LAILFSTEFLKNLTVDFLRFYLIKKNTRDYLKKSNSWNLKIFALVNHFSHLPKINLNSKVDFENYKGNELEVGHFRPNLEAERDETLDQNLREHGQKTSIFHFKLEASGYFQ
jgi:hypothetical protein